MNFMGIKEAELGVFGLLEAFDRCTPEDIDAFRKSLEPEGAETFERIDEYKRQLMAVLWMLGEDEIRQMQLDFRGKYLVGFHELGNELMLLEMIKPAHRG